MPMPYMKPIEHISAWRGSDLRDEDVFMPVLERHVRALDSALEAVIARGLNVNEIGPGDFPLPGIAKDIEDIYTRIIQGRGLVVLRGLPVERYSVDELEIMYWGLGTHFGKGVSQSVMGDRIGHVTDVSGKDPNERAYRNSLAVPSHTDLADIVGMLSIRKARAGGLSTYTSVPAIHNAILAQRPECLAPLYAGYRVHRFGQQGPGEPAVTTHRVPVLSQEQGHLSCRIVPEYIDMAEVELGEPLAPLEREALDLFLKLADDTKLRFALMLEPGDLSLINNYFVLHSRTEFFDEEEPDRRRLLLRLWLIANDRRPVCEGFTRAEEDGIAAQPDRKNSYYEGDAARAANRGRYGENLPER